MRLVALAAAATGQTKKPNILVIWGDDIGYWNISHNSHGMMGYQSPNIDRAPGKVSPSPITTRSNPAMPAARPAGTRAVNQTIDAHLVVTRDPGPYATFRATAVARHVFERNADQKQMDGIQAAVGLVIRAAIHRQFKLGERRDFRIGQLTWTADAAIITDSNSRTGLLCRVSVIIFGNGSNMARTEQIIRLRILGRMTPQSR